MPVPGWSLNARPQQLLATVGLLTARRAALLRAGIELQGEWKEVLNTAGAGKEYGPGVSFITTKGKGARKVVAIAGSPGAPSRGSSHVASAPGDAPAPDTGTLKNSIGVVPQPSGAVRVGSNLRYSLALEYGVNVSGSKTGPHPGENYRLQPRPHARPAKARAQEAMTAGIRLVMQGLVRGPQLGGKG